MKRTAQWLNELTSKINSKVAQAEFKNQLSDIHSKYAKTEYFILSGFILYSLLLMQIVMKGVKEAGSWKERFQVLLKGAVINLVICTGIILFSKFLPENNIAGMFNNFLEKFSLSTFLIFVIPFGAIVLAFIWGLIAVILNSKKNN